MVNHFIRTSRLWQYAYVTTVDLLIDGINNEQSTLVCLVTKKALPRPAISRTLQTHQNFRLGMPSAVCGKKCSPRRKEFGGSGSQEY